MWKGSAGSCACALLDCFVGLIAVYGGQSMVVSTEVGESCASASGLQERPVQFC